MRLGGWLATALRTIMAVFGKQAQRALVVRTTGSAVEARTNVISGPARSSLVEETDELPARGISKVFWSYVLLVLTPALINFAYLGFVATPQYVSEIKLVVRSADRNEALKEGISMLQRMAKIDGGGTQQDAQIALSYIKSRAIIEDIGDKAIMTAIYSRPKIDYFSRLDPEAGKEDILKYWKNRVTGSIDVISGIITVRVRAFSAEDAKNLAIKIIESSEKLINDVSTRTREATLSRAIAEVDRSAAALAAQRQSLLEFRNRSGSIDPVEDVKSVSTMISTLTMEKIEIEATMAALAGSIAEGSLVDRQRKTQIEVLNKKIDELQATLTSKNAANAISEKIREFEQIKLKTLFAETIYQLSQREYETARADMARQQLFIASIVPPEIAESASYPKVFLEGILFLVVATMLWGIVVLLIASVTDHA